jgi:hypothetical protein
MHSRASTNPWCPLSHFGAPRLVCAALAAILQTVVLAAADGVPKLNVAPSCEAAGAGSVVAGRNKGACMGDEQVARDDLVKTWSTYSAADKTLCVGMNRTGGPSSYVELLSCLNIIKDAKAIRKTMALAEPLVNNGQLDTRSLAANDLDDDSSNGNGDKKARRARKRNGR